MRSDFYTNEPLKKELRVVEWKAQTGGDEKEEKESVEYAGSGGTSPE